VTPVQAMAGRAAEAGPQAPPIPPARPASVASVASVPTVAIVEGPIDVDALVRAVGDPGAGATVLFLGTVRETNEGRAVSGIDYQAYAAMAEREMRVIADEAASRFRTRALAVHHRVGHLAVGVPSVAIAAAHERRAPAFDAARYVIEQLKRRVPIWKREHYVDGTREWVDPTGGAVDRTPGELA